MATVLTEYGSGFYGMEQPGVRAFLIVGDERALVVDTGMEPFDVLPLVRTVTDLPCSLFSTHGDGDHTANHNQFDVCFCHADERPVFADPRSNVTCRLEPVADGHTFDLGGIRLEVIHTPGHTPGHCCLLCRDGRWLISGDIVSYDTVFLFGPHRNITRYRDTLDELAKLRDEFDLIYPCHGPGPLPIQALDEMRECVDEALAGHLPGESNAFPFPVEQDVKKYAHGNCSIFYDGAVGGGTPV